MNISGVRSILAGINDIKVIGRSAVLDGVVSNVMGLARHGGEMRLLILQYDECFHEKAIEAEWQELNASSGKPENNRALLRNDRFLDARDPFPSVLKVFIGENEFVVYRTERRRLDAKDPESILTIAKFLDNGWQPSGIEDFSIDMLFLTTLKVSGDFDSISACSRDQELRFILGPHSEVHQVEKPITLIVGDNYKDKIVFHDKDTGEEHWVRINRVYLSDIWEEMNKIFTHPKLKEQLTAEEIARVRSDFENKFREVCPRGMYYPVIEYECEEDISLQFYSRAFLDAQPLNKGSSMGFLIRPDQPTGILGLKLKAIAIQEPVPANTGVIEAELFQYTRIISGGDIIL